MKIAIVGLGLIGGSLGRAICSKTRDRVYAFDIDEKSMSTGRLLSAYHERLTDKNVGEMDVIIFSLYPDVLERELDFYCNKLKNGCLVIDLCGNKRRVVNQMQCLAEKYPHLEFISAHPMAGREFSGVSHSTTTLFDRASMILVPVKADIRTIKWLKEYSLALGFGKVVMSTAEEHDRIIAFTSQLAHLVSSAYVKSDQAQKSGGFSAGSFRDMTRVAKLSPEMWAELTLDNADHLTDELDKFIKHLQEYREALFSGDKDQLVKLLEDGNRIKIDVEKTRRKG
ncbi:MAG: prephenate dehydrogenase/arogenate dehydrogenase family protein [Clostridia bacterium]|nr:prephenate dehydrogenase/arogenate dehydrogenase family protein [Clostridia bacterium]MBQ6883109.1 prephenate dehydrogenase/arogenate dehydrogenase family protein [Clostridia bacterium]